MILKYSWYNDRGLIYEGTFIEQASKEFEIGDWFLSSRICKYCKVPILMQIAKMEIAYYFNGEPIYDFTDTEGSGHKSNLKHVSLYDNFIKDIDFTDKFNRR